MMFLIKFQEYLEKVYSCSGAYKLINLIQLKVEVEVPTIHRVIKTRRGHRNFHSLNKDNVILAAVDKTEKNEMKTYYALEPRKSI